MDGASSLRGVHLHVAADSGMGCEHDYQIDKEDNPMKVPALIAVLIYLFTWPAAVFSAPIFAADAQNVRIVLTDEPCTLKAVSNLPFRATWTEKEKVYEGCWSPRPDEGYVVGYFEDLTVALIPIQAFKKLVGA